MKRKNSFYFFWINKITIKSLFIFNEIQINDTKKQFFFKYNVIQLENFKNKKKLKFNICIQKNYNTLIIKIKYKKVKNF